MEIAARLELSEGAVKVAVHRLRRRYRTLLRAAIAETVSNEANLDDEMRYLVAVLTEAVSIVRNLPGPLLSGRGE